MDVIDAEWIKGRLTNRHGELKALADAVGLTPDKITKILKGQRQVKSHEAPRFVAFFDRAQPGFAEAKAEYQSQAVLADPTARIRSVIAAICPDIPNAEAYRIREQALGAGLLTNDLLVVQLGMTAAPGDLVVVTIADTTHDIQTTVVRWYWPPMIVPLSSRDPYPACDAESDQAAAIVASVKAVVRGGAVA